MRRTSRLERLARREEKAVIRRVVVLSLISLVLITLIFTLGTSALGKFSDIIFAVFQNKKDSQTSNKAAPPAPRINTFAQATNSARFKIDGFSEGKTVQIYLNGNKTGEADVVDGAFKFEDINLKSGENTLAAKAVGDNGSESDLSPASKIVFSIKEPKLEVDSPKDGDSFSGNNRIKVTGQADATSQVYANGFLANINADGHFEVFVPLVENDNNIEVKAIDDAGNTKIVTRKVSFHK